MVGKIIGTLTRPIMASVITVNRFDFFSNIDSSNDMQRVSISQI